MKDLPNDFRLLMRFRRLLIVALHMGFIVLSNYSAFWLRFDGSIPQEYAEQFYALLPWLLVIRAVIFIPFRLYEGLWRYTSILELRNIIAGVGLSTIVFYLVVHGFFGMESYPRSIFLIDTLVLTFLMGGVRLSRRLYAKVRRTNGEKKVLIYGAGDAGEMIVRDMLNNGALYHYEPVGFIDDNPQKRRQHIHGVPVLGGRESVAKILETKAPDEILIAIPSAAPAVMRELLTIFAPYKIPIKTLPSHVRLQADNVGVSQMQKLSVEDLLERLPVGLDLEPIKRFINGKRVIVTGAGGSIGSELCRQIAKYQPESLVLLDKSESALYDIDMEIQRSYPELHRAAALADITNKIRLKDIFSTHAPQIVFHAAAYKHVPMMEEHPGEAIFNNVIGTHRLVQAALEENVQRFVLISTDKAVNPTNVMGATKRAGEIYIQALARQQKTGGTIFSAVRFGNVLGSNGSVVPLFLRQIKEGGPVTLTHPEIKRYFMTIPEAVLLVLCSATQARGGEIFVLDMGEQIKLLDMARHLIRLSGFTPEKDIAIKIVGMRPGEKLREELVAVDETIVATEIEKVLRVQPGSIADLSFLTQKIEELERLTSIGQAHLGLEVLYEMVPTYRSLNPDNSERIRRERAQMAEVGNLRIASQSA